MQFKPHRLETCAFQPLLCDGRPISNRVFFLFFQVLGTGRDDRNRCNGK